VQRIKFANKESSLPKSIREEPEKRWGPLRQMSQRVTPVASTRRLRAVAVLALTIVAADQAGVGRFRQVGERVHSTLSGPSSFRIAASRSIHGPIPQGE
jgi:hypothetical protein